MRRSRDRGRVLVTALVALLFAGPAALGAGDAPAAGGRAGAPRGPRPARLRPAPGLSGSLSRMILDELLGPGVDVALEGDDLVISVDVAKLAAAAASSEPPAPVAAAKPAPARADGLVQLRARPSFRPGDPDRPTVCLVHGLHSNSTVFLHVVKELEAAGFGVVLCDYPDLQALTDTGPQFNRTWKAFRAAAGETRPWVLLTHSMGALLARNYVEGADYADDVSDLILIGPPNRGAAIARMQPLVSIVEQLQAASAERSRREEAISGLDTAAAPSARDLLPESEFLKQLNARPRRPGVRYHILAGSGGFLSVDLRREVEARLGLKTSGREGLLGNLARLTLGNVPAQLDELTEGTGDGAVAIASTKLEGAPEPLVIRANHVELVRGPLLYPDPGPVACMPHVLRWLAPLRDAR